MQTEHLIEKILRLYGNNPNRWTKGAFARKKKTDKTPSLITDKEAACFCIGGACRKVGGTIVDEARLASVLGFGSHFDGINTMREWNDDPKRRFRHVQERLRAGLKRCQNQK
jgi:hypothetical protein